MLSCIEVLWRSYYKALIHFMMSLVTMIVDAPSMNIAPILGQEKMGFGIFIPVSFVNVL